MINILEERKGVGKRETEDKQTGREGKGGRDRERGRG